MTKRSKPIEVAVGRPVKGVRPDFRGVAGELVDEIPADLVFGGKGHRISPYDEPLRQLAAAEGHKWLKFGYARARVSVNVRARKMGLKVVCAESNGTLFVQFVGRAADDVAGGRRDAIGGILKGAPSGLTAMQITGLMRSKGDATIDASLTETILLQMMRTGSVIRTEDGMWKISPVRKAA